MAEFVSAIVGLIVAGAKVGDSLYALIDTLKDAPDEFRALSDELTDFRAILSRAVEANDSGEFALEEGRPATDFDLARVKGEAVVQDIEKLVQRVSKEQSAESKETQVQRIRWLRRVKKARKLQASLRFQKSHICNFIALGMLCVPRVKRSSNQGNPLIE